MRAKPPEAPFGNRRSVSAIGWDRAQHRETRRWDSMGALGSRHSKTGKMWPSICFHLFNMHISPPRNVNEVEIIKKSSLSSWDNRN